MRFLPVNQNIIIAELANLDETLTLLDRLNDTPVQGIAEIIPAARTLMIRFEPTLLSAQKLAAELEKYDLSRRRATSHEVVEIPVHYTGDDLEEVAQLLGITVQEVIKRHTESNYSVAFTGFAPGFAYLVGGDPIFNVPRRKVPRVRLPAGAVGLAGTFSGVYPQPSPGGWQIIGVTETPMFDLEREPAALLQPGFRVRFYDVGQKKPQKATTQTTKKAKPQQQPDKDSQAVLRISSCGMPVLFEDMGRIGQAKQGISPSGALDRGSFKNANKLVGNKDSATCLEITLGGLCFEVLAKTVMALSGAGCLITIKTAKGHSYQVAHNKPFQLEAGDSVSLGAPQKGVRSYLAVRGGFAVPYVLDSTSRDTLANIGPAIPVVGDVLSAYHAPQNALVALDAIQAFAMPSSEDIVTLDIIMGPRTDWFSDEAIKLFLTQLWDVTAQSNRVGNRLQGEIALERRITNELPSEGTATGAIQVPASGQPVLFLADRPLTGGYPVIAVVANHHLDLAAQIPVGAKIRFHALTTFEDIKPA